MPETMTILHRRPLAGSGFMRSIATFNVSSGPMKLSSNSARQTYGSGIGSPARCGCGGMIIAPSRSIDRSAIPIAKAPIEDMDAISSSSTACGADDLQNSWRSKVDKLEVFLAARTSRWHNFAKRSQTALPIPPVAPVTRTA